MARRFWALGILGLFAGVAFAAGATKIYEGAWFTVKYPASFVARKSTADSAFFAAKDGSVQFYVFSPQWSGEPKDFALNMKTETVVQSGKRRDKSVVVRRMTVKAKDGSYFRSWVDTQDSGLHTRLVFGIKYKNAKALAAWRDAYLAFKRSLTQYAD